MEIKHCNSINHSGRILTKGKWSLTLAEAFKENPEVKKLADGEYNIIGKMQTRTSHPLDINHLQDEPLYRLSLTCRREQPSIMDRVKSFLRIGKTVKITRNYHDEDEMLNIIDKRIKAETLGKKLNICK